MRPLGPYNDLRRHRTWEDVEMVAMEPHERSSIEVPSLAKGVLHASLLMRPDEVLARMLSRADGLPAGRATRADATPESSLGPLLQDSSCVQLQSRGEENTA
jgi:hypothetical protein